MFVVTLTYIQPLDKVDALLEAHKAWLKQGYEAGVFLASGRKVPRDGGVILCKAASREALEAVLAADPFALASVARYEVVQFEATMTAAGLEPLLD
ncbi:YciI family protein [Gallaecimonas kandeliae]|uniref:YciI family protein n=1 Tax=Gallaecimonas kandeliae TaxID=3029055 RepID=UPI00264907EE|nr:YciI family protein [Gallaecimonas kandeliae]WKE65024.1 YciI family protein [Gallaecimonas kandeliae]